ncbi:hypothetical protein QUT48_23045, partial [Xanthomonas citri pv. citri]
MDKNQRNLQDMSNGVWGGDVNWNDRTKSFLCTTVIAGKMSRSLDDSTITTVNAGPKPDGTVDLCHDTQYEDC